MTDRHDPDPDPAALDELLRAFAVDAEPKQASRTPGPGDEESTPITPPGLANDDPTPTETAEEPAEIVIVEQEPLSDTDEPTPAPAVIRIDDYSGSVAIEPGTVRSDVTRGAVTPSAPNPTTNPTTHPGSVPGSPVVIAIDDSDLPDPVYVEGNLERSGTRSIVFIEDDDTGDALVPETERDIRRGIEPRMRERRAAVKRAIGRKRLRWAAVIVAVVVIAVGTLAVLGSGLFAIRAENVTVVGAVYADPERLEAIVDDLVGTPVLVADTTAAEAALESIPWVAEARVRTTFPHSVSIEIREREAMATYQGPDLRFRVLDRDGRVLDVLDGDPIAYLLLDGPDPVDLEPGEFAPTGYAAASELAKNLTGSIRGQIAYVEVTADGSNLALHLEDGSEVRFGAASDLFAKLVRLETVLTRNPDREPGVIDVSTREVTL